MATKADFINAVHDALGGDGTKKATAEAVEAVFGVLAGAIREGRFSYPGFGTFNVKERGERKGRNPRTGEAITIKASKSVGFKPAPAFKDSL